MSDDFDLMYKLSLKDHRSLAKKRLNANMRAYDSLKENTSKYAKTIKVLQILHKQVSDIYDNAENDLLIAISALPNEKPND